MQKLEQSAQKANDRISELLETYRTLKEEESRAASEARADIAVQAEAVHRQGEKAAKHLNELAEKDILGKLSNGTEIAETRINDLSEALDELYRRRENASNSEAEQARLEKIIAANERLLGVYQRNLEATQNSAGMENLVDSAEIANQYIVDLNQELLALKERQAELEQSGISLGYEEYDQNTARIAEITRELKDYQKALSGTGGRCGITGQQDRAGDGEIQLHHEQIIAGVWRENVRNYWKTFTPVGDSGPTVGRKNRPGL